MGIEAALSNWDRYEDPLLFVSVALSVMVVLTMWAFRTPQVPWRVRVVYQTGVLAQVARAYLLRVVEIDRGWITNAITLYFIGATLLLLFSVVKGSGLFGPRDTPPGRVP